MGKRRKWNIGLLSGETAGLTMLSAAFLLGGFVGCIAVGLVDTQGQEVLADYVGSYMSQLLQDGVRPQFWPLVWDVLFLPLLAFGLGFTALGVVGLPVLFAAKGFLLSFAISVFYCLFGLSGQMTAFFLFGLSSLILLPALFHLGVQGISASYSLLRRAVGDGRYPLGYNYRYIARSGLCGAAVCVGIGVEYLFVPALMRVMAAGL